MSEVDKLIEGLEAWPHVRQKGDPDRLINKALAHLQALRTQSQQIEKITDEYKEAIEQAVLEEGERCAKLMETFPERVKKMVRIEEYTDLTSMGREYVVPAHDVARNVPATNADRAAAIRNSTKGEG